MASFSIFNELENTNSSRVCKGKENSYTLISSKTNSIRSTVTTSVKNVPKLINKTKGLSVRSKSDLNVLDLSKLQVSSKDNLKSQDKHSIAKNLKVSPCKLKSLKNKSLAGKKLSPKILSPIMKNVTDDFQFTKPATPKSTIKLKKYSDPERLSYNDDYEYINKEMEDIFNQDSHFLKSVSRFNDSITSFDDEGFISDTELNQIESGSKLLSPLPFINDVELPQISDDDEDEFC